VAAIIAGGRGTRLGGVDKSALLVGGRSILSRQLAVLRPLFPRILMVTGTRPPHGSGVVVVHDRAPGGQGPLAGIDAALAALLPGERAVVCVGCDMPLITAPALQLLRELAPDAEAVVPSIAGHSEPLFARYSRAAGRTVAAALAERRLRTGDVLRSLRVHWLREPTLREVDPALLSLENVNTAQDLARVDGLARAAFG
jgi:molybdopterin-guanine dinucleotide biosynthesis protein A